MSLFPESDPQLGPAMKVGMGRMLAGAPSKPRQPNDYYPTPAPVTRALLAREAHCIAAALGFDDPRPPVWEPCGRGGAILAELRGAGFDAVGTDIVADPDHGVTRLDLLLAKRALGPAVVTNPPFALAAPMILHLLGTLRVGYCALLLKSTFWHAADRTALFRIHPPARILALNWRPDFLGQGAPTMEVIWCVWARGWAGGTRYDVLEPAAEGGLFGEGFGDE